MKLKAVLSLFFLLFLVTGCAAPPSQPTAVVTQAAEQPANTAASQASLTFGKDGCRYSGPPLLSAKFDLTWDLQDLGQTTYMVYAVMLEDGKTLTDLSSAAFEKPVPSWITTLGYDQATGPGTHTKTFNFSANANFKEGQFYFVCTFALKGKPYGVAGPVNMVK